MTDENPDHAPFEEVVFDEFEPGDPRRGPHSQETQAEAAALANAAGRWHARNPHVDWFAVRLQVGRGLKSREVAGMFGIGHSTIDRRRLEEDWGRRPGEADRRRLSVNVWLAGVDRLTPGDIAGRDALKAASEWRLHQPPTHPVWREKNPDGEPLRFTINDLSRGFR
ncbi:MAG TPA: hypothetical protein VFV70_01740 [Hyphomonadaceae bacterium]|nr:hypothetical protein [Hyphomonadaceae bacterium]